MPQLKTKNSPPLSKLPYLRKQISKMDVKLLTLLQKRFAVVEKIGDLKRAHGLAIVQKDRLRILDDLWLEEAQKRNLNLRFIKKILHYIHSESVRLQKK